MRKNEAVCRKTLFSLLSEYDLMIRGGAPLTQKAFANNEELSSPTVHTLQWRVRFSGIQLNSETRDGRRTLWWFDPINAKALMYSTVCMEREERPRSNRVTGGCAWKKKQVAVYTHAPDSSEGSLPEHFKPFQQTLYVLTPVTAHLFPGVYKTDVTKLRLQ